MREIKFRAWDKEKKVMIPNITLGGLKNWENVNHYEWMQFTGLLDKNGKEIYEGDIVKYKMLEGFACQEENWRESSEAEECPPKEVKFEDGCFFPREMAELPSDGFYSFRFFDLEVIGSITRTPNLLPPPKIS